MKKSLILLTVFVFSILLAAGEAADKNQKKNNESQITARMVIDDFEDGNISASPKWWVFDKILVNFSTVKGYGEHTLVVKGKTNSWYVGGMGTYIGKDASQYDRVCLSVFGKGENSGKIKIQLYDDDNNTPELEQDEKWEPTSDDRFEYEIDVNWLGWKDLEIPLTSFKDTNPGVGDDIFNPDVENASGGLLHFQLIFNSPYETGEIELKLDNIKLIKRN